MVSPKPPTKTYKYINLETKKVDSIIFPHPGYWFHQNTFTWKTLQGEKLSYKYYKERNNQRNKWEHKIHIEQGVSWKGKKYRRMMEEMNKVYTIRKGNVYENMIWIMSKVKWTKKFFFTLNQMKPLQK